MSSPVVESMLKKYRIENTQMRMHALREIFQELALLGLWRGKFFEHAAFYGGTALRVLYGLDRFSEDIDFSLLKPDPLFTLMPYCRHIEEELRAFGFSATVSVKEKSIDSQIESAFLKAKTLEQLLVIDRGYHEDMTMPQLKIKIEVDTQPPPFFHTEVRTLLNPIPFGVRVFGLPSLFAGKMHAVLCRKWKQRVKGRDWYDLVWYVGRAIKLDVRHLEERMRQSGHWQTEALLTRDAVRSALHERIDAINIDQAREEVSRFLAIPDSTQVWSREFFYDIADRIEAA